MICLIIILLNTFVQKAYNKELLFSPPCINFKIIYVKKKITVHPNVFSNFLSLSLCIFEYRSYGEL